MKSTSDAPQPLDALIMGVVSAKTEFSTAGVPVDEILGAVRDELPDSPPEPRRIYAIIEYLLEHGLLIKTPCGKYTPFDLDANAKKLGLDDTWLAAIKSI